MCKPGFVLTAYVYCIQGQLLYCTVCTCLHSSSVFVPHHKILCTSDVQDGGRENRLHKIWRVTSVEFMVEAGQGEAAASNPHLAADRAGLMKREEVGGGLVRAAAAKGELLVDILAERTEEEEPTARGGAMQGVALMVEGEAAEARGLYKRTPHLLLGHCLKI